MRALGGRPSIKNPRIAAVTQTATPVTKLFNPVPTNVVSIAEIARRIPLVDQHDKHLRWLDEDEARDMIRRKRVELVWHRKRLAKLRLKENEPIELPLSVVDEEFSGNRAPAQCVHNQETDDNPRGCWTFRRRRALIAA